MSQAFFEKCGFDPFAALILEGEAEELGLKFVRLGPKTIVREFSTADNDDPDLLNRFEYEVVVEYRGVEIHATGRTPRRAIGMIFNAARR